MEMTYDGDHRVNDEPIDYAQWNLYDAPEASAELNSGIIRFEHEDESLTLDFGVDPSRQMIPMQAWWAEAAQAVAVPDLTVKQRPAPGCSQRSPDR